MNTRPGANAVVHRTFVVAQLRIEAKDGAVSRYSLAGPGGFEWFYATQRKAGRAAVEETVPPAPRAFNSIC